jgi:branched-chain amino acid transport system permease protein/neutral amino acid transport system permease protein
MTATTEIAQDSLKNRWRDYQLAVRNFLGAAGLWLLIGGLFLWAFVQERDLFVVGIIVGSILALGALGLTLIYGVLKFGNFAHGDTMMLGAYLAFFFLTGLVKETRRDTDLGASINDLPAATGRLGDLSFGYGFLLAIALAAVAVAAFSVGLDRLAYRRLRQRKSGTVIFAAASIGIAFAIRSVLLMVWGPEPRSYIGGIVPKNDYPLGISLKTNEVFTFLVALILSALVYFLLFRTRLGKAMRAYADNPDLSLVSGINTDRIIMWTWMVGGALMAVAGVLLGLQTILRPSLGFELLLPLFAAAILGGLGKPQGAFIGALVVGVSQETAIAFGPVLSDFFEIITLGLWSPHVYISAGYKPGVAFVILILILLLRPRGLFGGIT